MCIFLFFFYTQKKQNRKKSKTYFYKICRIIKINVAKQCFFPLMRAGYYEQTINYTWPKYWIYFSWSMVFSIRNLWPFCIMFFYVFFLNIIKVIHFLYPFIILLHLISSFSLAIFLFVPYAYVSNRSFDCILLLFEPKAILLIFSVTLFFLLLNLCCAYCFVWILYDFN